MILWYSDCSAPFVCLECGWPFTTISHWSSSFLNLYWERKVHWLICLPPLSRPRRYRLRAIMHVDRMSSLSCHSSGDQKMSHLPYNLEQWLASAAGFHYTLSTVILWKLHLLSETLWLPAWPFNAEDELCGFLNSDGYLYPCLAKLVWNAPANLNSIRIMFTGHLHTKNIFTLRCRN